MKKRTIVFALLGFLILTHAGLAETEGENSKPKIYFSSTGLSALLTAGNNKDLTISLDTDQNLTLNKDKLNLKGQAIYTRSNDEKQSEIYSAALKYDRQLNDRSYLLGLTQFSRNVLSGFNSRLAFLAGAGYSWVKKENITLATEAAFGWSTENSTEKMIGSTVDSLKKKSQASFLTSLLTVKMNWAISSTTEFTFQEDLFLNLANLSGYRFDTHSSLAVAINKLFALKTSVQVLYENNPVPGHKNTNVYALSSIIIKF